MSKNVKVELFLSLRYLFRGSLRHISFMSTLSCIGIILGVATLVIVLSVMNGFDKDLTDKLLSFNYHLIIESPNRSFLYRLRDELKRMEDIKSANLFISTQVFAKINDFIIPLMVKGIEFDDPKERSLFYQFVQEEFSKDGFFIGEGLAKKILPQKNIFYYPLKKKIKLESKNIRGIFKIGLYDLDSNYLVCSIQEAKDLSPNYLLFLGARVTRPFEVEKIKKRIKDIYPQVLVYSWIDSNRALFGALKLEKITMFFILSLIILVATFGIFSMLSVKVAEKTKDVGILKAIGFHSSRILRIFAFQGLTLGVIGTTLGVGVGVFLCYLIKEFKIIKIPQEIYFIDYLPVYVDVKDVIVVSFLTLILSFFASVVPATKASRLEVSYALRYE